MKSFSFVVVHVIDVGVLDDSDGFGRRGTLSWYLSVHEVVELDESGRELGDGRVFQLQGPHQ